MRNLNQYPITSEDCIRFLDEHKIENPKTFEDFQNNTIIYEIKEKLWILDDLRD